MFVVPLSKTTDGMSCGSAGHDGAATLDLSLVVVASGTVVKDSGACSADVGGDPVRTGDMLHAMLTSDGTTVCV